MSGKLRCWGTGDDDVVLKINGSKVRRGEFERLVSNQLQRQQQQGQAGLTIERDEIEQQVIDQIIQEQNLFEQRSD